MAIVCATCFGTGSTLGIRTLVQTIVGVPTGNMTTIYIATPQGVSIPLRVSEMTTALVNAYADGPPCPLCNGTGIL